MGRKEKQIINKALLEGSENGRLFRANSGSGWIGQTGFSGHDKLLLINPRKFHGMPAGTPDLIGWESKMLCEILSGDELEKLGCDIYSGTCKKDCPFHKKIAIFKGVEIKTGKLKLTPEQKRFRDILLEHGGIYEERRE